MIECKNYKLEIFDCIAPSFNGLCINYHFQNYEFETCIKIKNKKLCKVCFKLNDNEVPLQLELIDNEEKDNYFK